MNILQQIKEDESVKAYWEALLGEEMLSKILNQPEYQVFLEKNLFFSQQEREELQSVQQFCESFSQAEKTKEQEEWIFYPFYYRIYYYIRKKLDKVFQQRHLISVGKNVADNLSWQYTGKIQEIPLRCLLQEMEELKQKQKLQGENEKQQYEYFLKEYLDNKEFLTELAEKYPVMMELIDRKADAFAVDLAEMLSCLEQEKEQVEKYLCQGRKFNCIQNIETGLSDEHNPGKTVAKLTLDNGMIIYYKPRSLKAEQEYQKMYQWVCRQWGLENYDRGILDCGTHGWEGAAAAKSCKNPKEVWRYYERMGIHLCLSYLFGVSDIHFENIIACGEHPVLIDMEVFPGYREYEPLKDSVLRTGILPGQTWGNAGINVSAMGSLKKQKSPFKVPVIKDKNTSNMHISYETVELKSADCVPELYGKKAEAMSFLDAVEKGFEAAYQSVFQYREQWKDKISAMELWKSRYVIRHTQQYKMYQMTATFPEFMKERDKRRLMLLRMERGLQCEEEHKKKILFYEAECIEQQIFPVYYVKGKDLELGNGNLLPNYFKESIQEQVIARLNRMGRKDKYRQQKFIALSMSAEESLNIEERREVKEDPNMEESREMKESPNVEVSLNIEESRGVKETPNIGNSYNAKKLPLTAPKIAQQLQMDMEKIEDKASWIGLKYNREGSWQLQTIGMYLYDGIAGITIFLMAYRSVYGMEQYGELCEELLQHMFSYTDRALQNPQNLESRNTGIMCGESSLIYTYLVLYHIRKEERFLKYAKKHASIVKELLKEDRKFDLLEGNAGAIIALVHLHRITKEKSYLEMAKQAAEELLVHAVQTEAGIGWQLSGQSQPLAGMAHGNSGMMLAFARLWQASGVARYYAVMEQIRAYEDTLYNETMKNWEDIRETKKGHGKDVTAWCHGATGILIATAQTDRIIGIEPTEDWRCQQAEEKVHKTRKQECCLCHGRMGNAAALRYGRMGNAAAMCYKREGTGQTENRMTSENRNFPKYLEVPAWEEIPAKEKYQMGFMTGLTGIGYELLKREATWLPEILALDVL